MPKLFHHWGRIIGAALLALALAGCSMVRLGYGQGPTLAYHWLDGYFDFNGEQMPRVRDAIEQWFDWHRRTQLSDYAALLVRVQVQVAAPDLSAEAMCSWRDEVQRRADAAIEQAVPALAALLLTLTPEQLRHFERKMGRDSAKLREEVVPADPADRAKAALARNLDRYENFYGRLDQAQRERLAQWLLQSPSQPERWLAERAQRQADIVATVGAVQARARTLDPAAAQAAAQEAVRALATRLMRSPRPDYRAWQERSAADACAQAATMHALMRPAQREAARSKLKGWEEDLRVLAGAAGNGKVAQAD